MVQPDSIPFTTTAGQEVRLPVWYLNVVAEWLLGRRTGDLETSFRHGEIKHVREGALRFPPEQPAVKAGALICPTCLGPLAEQDYGNKARCVVCPATYAVQRRGMAVVGLRKLAET